MQSCTAVFLHALIDGDIYICQPEGFINAEHPDWVCKLHKSLYGLKQAPLLWFHLIDAHLRSSGFAPTTGDPCVYVGSVNGWIAIIAVYVDDCPIIAHPDDITTVKMVLSSRFDMKDLGPVASILGIEILHNWEKGVMQLRQCSQINDLLLTFNMTNCNPTATPMEEHLNLKRSKSNDSPLPYCQAVRKLLYIAITS
jgi:histone deacetylase 1/2